MKKLSWFWRRDERHSDHWDWARAVTPLAMPESPKEAAARRRRTHDEQLRALVDSVKDFQLTHGSLVKLVQSEEEHSVLARPIGVTLYPTRFPRAAFDETEALQTAFNELYAAVACDEAWLRHALRPLLTKGSLAAKLWSIHADVRREGFVQNWALGIFRSDYMLQAARDGAGRLVATPKQVEFNTYSCAGTAHAARASAMHRHLCLSGAYRGSRDDSVALDRLPLRDGLAGTLRALAAAAREYRRQRRLAAAAAARPAACVLMVVQPFNVNVADERPVEFGLWKRGVPAYHVEWGAQFLQHTYLTRDRELFFTPPGRPGADPVEVAVVYHRAGYDEAEYDIEGIQCRLRAERSRAIKCPSILAHLAGFKKVQQALADPGQVERFVDADAAARLRRTFVPMYPMDDSMRGLRGRELATLPQTAALHVLKPSLEGGGHNVHRAAIPEFLSEIPQSAWRHYVLMEGIVPPPAANVLLGPRGLHAGAVESELGMVGTCLWKCHGHGDAPPRPRVAQNACVGFTFKAKARGEEEMSVIKGYGCFDSPLLVD